MVKVRRLSEPPLLTENRDEWVARWARILSGKEAGDWATAAAKREIRGVLLEMTHGKCAYCESPLEVTAPAEIEHYVHKRREPWDPQLALAWTNLLPACPACNNAKGAIVHDGRLVKPDEEDPEPMFWLNLLNGELEPHPRLDEEARQSAEFAIRTCRLCRGGLCEARLDCRQAAVHAARQDDLERVLEPRYPYKLVVRLALKELGLELEAERDRAFFLGESD